MMTFKRAPVLQWLIAALALVPLILYAYLGQFSRMIADDYCEIAEGQKLGAWDYMVQWLDTWGGAYTDAFFKGAMAPLDTLVPRMMPTLIIVLWLVGLSWLVFQGLAYLRIDHSRRAFSIAISALVITATVHAFHSPQSFYWASASIRYVLPLALLTIYLALTLWLARRSGLSGAVNRGSHPLDPTKERRGALRVGAIIAGAALCFISAGASEIFVAFQATFLTFCLLMSGVFLRSSVRRRYLPIFGAGWLATLAGLVIQLSSPGITIRAESIVQVYGQPYRSLPTIISETLARTLGYIGHPQAFAGLMMLMGVGLLVMLIQYKPQAALKTLEPVKLALPPLWTGLIVQLIFIPILWQHTSEHPQLLGRFSIRYMTAIILNIIFILGFLALLWRRNHINVELQKHEHGLLIVWYTIAFMFAAILLAFIRMQDIHYRASTYLITSFLVFLGIIIWQLYSVTQTRLTQKIGLLALFAYATAVVCIAAVFAVALFGRGFFVAKRILAPGAWLLMLPGLIWGIYTGYLIKNHPLSSQAGQVWIRLLKLASLAIVLIIAMGIVLGQAALAPDFQSFAQEWDTRHQEIIAMRDSGQTIIEAAPLTFDLADFIYIATLADSPADRCAARYYGVDSIIVPDG